MHKLERSAWRDGSLRRTLLILLIPLLLLIFCISLFETWRLAQDSANAAYDRSLYGAVKSIDANISTASGGLGVELPYRMLEFFELTASGSVYYRIATEDGLAEIGNADLPRPPPGLKSTQPEFRDEIYHGQAVRVVSYARIMQPPLAGQRENQRVVIQVAESIEARAQFRRELVLKAATRDAAVIMLAGMLVVASVSWALQPLRNARQEVEARAPEDLTPIPAAQLPTDVRPLVEALNVHMERNRAQSQSLRNFIDDASHQLRTPLTTLATQVGFALRESSALSWETTLQAIKLQLDNTIRQTNQMLSLARADSAQLNFEPINLVDSTRSTCREWWSIARQAGIDLGFEGDESEAQINADSGLLSEMLANLLSNAIEHTPSGGQITVSVRQSAEEVTLTVQDSGSGIPEVELGRAGERFFRASNSTRSGTGLGLAIVRAIMDRHAGQLELSNGPQEKGLMVRLRFGRPKS